MLEKERRQEEKGLLREVPKRLIRVTFLLLGRVGSGRQEKRGSPCWEALRLAGGGGGH